MKFITVFLLVLFFCCDISARDWKFIGPDSSNWQNVVQMDVRFHFGKPHYIGIATTQGVCANLGNGWNYVLRDKYGNYFPPEDVYYRSIYFSPWVDSVAFVGINVSFYSEPGSSGGSVQNIHSPYWGFQAAFGGGYIGLSPSLTFEFSSYHPGKVYSWIIDLYKSTNNGLDWERSQNPPSYGVLFMALDRRRDSVIYIGSRFYGQSSFNIYRSVDDGNSWNFIAPLNISPNPFFSQRSADFIALGDTLILATNRFPNVADTTCGISISVDQGITWHRVLNNINIQKLLQDPSQHEIIYAAAQSGIYRSINTGLSWHLFTDSLPSLNLVDIRKDYYSDTLYIATSDSGVFKVFDISVDVSEEQMLPNKYYLYQNYPNPFNPSTIINYQLPFNSWVTLKVYDVLGREVATLIDEHKPAGKYRFEFRVSDFGLSSGVYYYQMKSGKYTETKKLILLR